MTSSSKATSKGGRSGLSLLKKSTLIVEQPLDNDLVLYHPVTGAGQLLNHTAARVWELCDGTRSVSTIARTLASDYGITVREARQDVDELVRELLDKGLLDQAGSQSSALPIRESQLEREGLSIGTIAPEFSLLDLEGERRSLAELRAGRAGIIVFSDPECGPCMALWPTLVSRYAELTAHNVALIVVSRGDPDANRAKAQSLGAPFPVLLQNHWEVSKDYAIFATPVGFALDSSGRVAANVAVGAMPIEELIDQALAKR
jgi:peroxiredoxin